MPHVERFSVPYIDVRSLISATPGDFMSTLAAIGRSLALLVERARHAARRRRAHPMYPVSSRNGASQAVLDARALADALVRSEHPRQALLAYEQKRLPMTAEIVRSNRRGGPEGGDRRRRATGARRLYRYRQGAEPRATRSHRARGYATKAGFAAPPPGLTAVRA